MLGAIIGDIVGSRFEWNNIKTKGFELFTDKCFPTDDSIMTLALAQAIMVSKPDYSDLSDNAIKCMQSIGRKYPDCGYGGSFHGWMFSNNPQPYGSFGNGSAMRVSAAGFVANSLEDAKRLSRLVTEVTHNHPEGIKGAEATAAAICGGVAEAYYGIPSDIRKRAVTFLDDSLLKILVAFEDKYPSVRIAQA